LIFFVCYFQKIAFQPAKVIPFLQTRKQLSTKNKKKEENTPFEGATWAIKAAIFEQKPQIT
jgi:hypothetical protein